MSAQYRAPAPRAERGDREPGTRRTGPAVMSNRTAARLVAGRRPPAVQRQVNLREKYPAEKYPALYGPAKGKDRHPLIYGYERIQRVIRDRVFIEAYLGELEKEVAARVSELGPHLALSSALRRQEAKWSAAPLGALIDQEPSAQSVKMLKSEGALRVTAISDTSKPEYEKFLKAGPSSGAPFSDYGAPASHGAYAHRLQWYVIAKFYEKSDVSPAWPERVQELYQASGSLAFFQQHEGDTADPFRALWDYVNDVRGKEVTSGAVEFRAEGYTPEKDVVPAASPVKLTEMLSWGKDFGGALVGQLPNTALAVTAQRRLRYLERQRARFSEIEGLAAAIEEARRDPEQEATKTFKERVRKLAVLKAMRAQLDDPATLLEWAKKKLGVEY